MKYIILLGVFFHMAFGIELTYEEQKFLEQKNNTITMCVDPDWEPFEIINQKGKHEGIAADLIQLIASRLEINIKLIPTQTWQKAIVYSKEGRCDILSFLNETPQRKEWLTFTEPIFNDPNVLVGRAEMKYIEDISKENLSIALPKDTAMAERFAKDFPNLTIIPTISESEAFKLVEDKKADLTLRSLIVAAYTIKKDGLFNLKIVGEPKGYENHLRIGVLKQQPILKDILNKAIATITQDDTKNIINNHVTIVIEKVTYFTIGVYVFGVLIFIFLVIGFWNYSLQKRVVFEVAKNKEQQQALFQKHKQAELGNIIGNISHQWRDGLANISSNNMTILAKIDYGVEITKEELEKKAKEIEKAVDFMSDTMKNFLDFYKVSSKKEKFSVLHSIQDTLKIIDMQFTLYKIELHIECEEDFFLEGIKNEWMNIWFNILNNGINVVQNREIETPTIWIKISSEQISFLDNFGGIEKELLEKIIQKRSSGLGLVMSQEIVKKYGFRMKIMNEESGVQINFFKM